MAVTSHCVAVYLLLLTAAGVSSSKNATSGSHWDYDGKSADWSIWSRECKIGRAQSPIDIQTRSVIFDSNMKLSMHGFDQEIPGSALLLQNNGHTVQVTLDRSALPTYAPFVTGSAVNGSKFEFVQLHFHWDDDDDHGSEHAIDGKRYALEVSHCLSTQSQRLYSKSCTVHAAHRCTTSWPTSSTAVMWPRQAHSQTV